MSITLTPAAAARVTTQLAQRGAGVGLKLGVKKNGCSGYAYQVDFADSVGADDTVFESLGVKLVVANNALEQLQGMTLDYARDGLNSSFKFVNPNVTGMCGCGDSFTTD